MAPPTMALGLMRNFLLIRCMHTAAAFSRFTLRANIRALQRMPPIASMATMPARVSFSPEVVEVDATQRHVLDSVNLSAPTLKVLQKKGFETLTAIQAAVFPCAREGRDVLARSRTGTGKTIAFALPLLEQLIGQERSPFPKMIVLCPTRELAKQVYEEIQSVATIHGLRGATVYGGVSYTKQVDDLRHGVHFIVGTPGRVNDLITAKQLSLKEVMHVVLDEADRMLDMGFAEQVETVLATCPSGRQTLLFSATIPDWVSKLSKKFMKEYVYVDAVGDDDSRLATTISHTAIKLPSTGRDSAIATYLEDVILTVRADKIKKALASGEPFSKGKTLVFFNTKDECTRAVSGNSFNIFKATALHGDMSQSQRDITLAEFKRGNIDVLVATDVAARGLDVSDIEYVIHCYPPRDPDTYVHRSGRTGRAEKRGDVVVLYQQSEASALRSLERELEFKFEHRELPTWNATINASAMFAYTQLAKVNKDISLEFSASAKEVLAASGADSNNAPLVSLVSRSLAALSNRFEKQERSLLNAAPGLQTLLMETNTSRPLTIPAVVAKLKQLMRETPDVDDENVRSVRLCTDSRKACVDISSKVAKLLLAQQDDSADFRLEAIKVLPELADVPESFDRGFNKPRFGGSGGFGRGSGGGFRGGDRRSDRFGGDKQSDRFGGDRDRRSGSQYGGSSYGDRGFSGDRAPRRKW